MEKKKKVFIVTGILVFLVVLALIIFMPKSVLRVQSQEVRAFNNELERAYSGVEDYSVRVVAKNILGEISQEIDYYFKKTNKLKIVWVTPDKGIEVKISEGGITDSLVYDKIKNTLFTSTSKSPSDDSSLLDFVEALKQYIKENEVDVEDVTYNNKPAYKLTIQPNSKGEGITVYWVDKETMWPVKIDNYLGEGRCESLKEFYSTYVNLEITSCISFSEEFQNLQFNLGLSDEIFNIRNDIPSDAEEKTGFGGECNPVMETAKPLEEASFQVYAPEWVPERFKVNYAPKGIEIKPFKCPESGFPEEAPYKNTYGDYANVHQEKIHDFSDPFDKEEFEVASIGLNVVIKEGKYTFSGISELRQSPSIINYRILSLYSKDKLMESKKVNINGVEGTLNKYKEVFPNRVSTRRPNGTVENFDYGDAIFYTSTLFWKANGLYFTLVTSSNSRSWSIEGQGPDDASSRSPFADNVPKEIYLSDEEMIQIASSLEPLKNACGDTNGDNVLDQSDLDAITSYAFQGVDIPAEVNADLNDDGVVNILDVNIMTDHVKRNKPKPTCEKTYECGDVNQDGVINKDDVTKITDYIFNSVSISQIELKLIDLNDDDISDVLDITILTNYVYRNGAKPSCSSQNLEQGNSYAATINACGNLNEDLKIDKSDVDNIVNYVFRGGSLAPGINPDLNRDGVTDVLDVTLLTNYVYRNGSAPTC